MKYRDTAGRLFQPGFIADIPTGKLLWVDSVNGNDALAVRQRLSVPFKTLGAAKAAADPGDTIVVMPGTYNEKNLLKDQVNWHFLAGAKVVYSGGSAGSIFDTSANGANEDVKSLITGAGMFENQADQTDSHVVNSSASGSDLIIRAHSLVANRSTVKMADNGAGRLDIEAFDQIHAGNWNAIWVTASGSTARCTIRTPVITATDDYTILVEGGSGSLVIDSHLITAGSSQALRIIGGSGTIIIKAFEIVSGSTETVYYAAGYNPVLSLLLTRVRCYTSSSGARAINIASGGSNKIKLVNCTLIVDSAATYSISAASATSVQYHGYTSANKASNNITAVGGSLLVNSNIA